MNATSPSKSPRLRRLLLTGPVMLAVLAACDDDDPSPVPPSVALPPKASTNVPRGEDPPGITIEIKSITGATSADGTFRAGDQVTVNFTMKRTKDGTSWRLDEMASGRIMLAGPSYNYQRVIPEQQDVLTRSVTNADGTFTYTFAAPIPAVYAAPINDTLAFTDLDGELSGQPLVAGTYTIGLYSTWSYTVDGQPFRDAGNATSDFLFGGATALTPREVVKQDNCNQCHQSLRAHGGSRREVKLCLLCHTSGSEDRNNSSVGGGTPGVTIDFRVLIHKLHNGAHLPSVLGVATNADGSRNYRAPKKPYQVAGNSLHDYSGINFPVWPNASVAMPRDQGYTALATADRTTEDAIRTGVADCSVCHGDPDGVGPKTAPAQGALAYAQPSRRACASCHDDIDWSRPYTANGSTMPAQANDSACLLCHGAVSNALSPEKAHLHPLADPAFNAGLKFELSSLVEAGTHNNDGTLDPGEKVAITFRMLDDKGAVVAPSAVASISAVMDGPTTNSNLLLNGSIPTAALTGTPPYTVNLPQTVYLEMVGSSTTTLGDEFTTIRTPHWDVTGAVTSLWVRTATAGGSTLTTSAVTAPQNWIDVADATGLGRNDWIALDEGQSTRLEYLQIQTVEGNRLWFSSPASSTYAYGAQKEHSVGAKVVEVTLTPKVKNTDYRLEPATGKITELTEFGDGNAVIVTYTADFVMPAQYGLALNDAPALDETAGEWAGKPLVDGTYAVTLWGSRNLTLSLFGETNSYRGTSNGARKEFLVGSATQLRPYELIASGANCNACHQEVLFHGGGRRSFETCIACHGTAGSEDRPRYVAPNAPATDGVTINFRTMLHKIHMGEDLANASSYTLVGFGSGAYPNNYTAHTYESIVFPALPGGVSNCTTCHGANNTAWLEPMERKHPTAQNKPVQAWRAVCGACHDSDAATAHIDVMTSGSGAESCTVCHDPDKEWHVRLVHKVR
jgi:OmcA/MtrC family decaheme c-type cytochrome